MSIWTWAGNCGHFVCGLIVSRGSDTLFLMVSKVATNGRILLPAELRKQDGIEAGHQFEIKRLGRGEYLLKRKRGRRNQGLVQLLVNCPAADWFQPLERHESTKDLSEQ